MHQFIEHKPGEWSVGRYDVSGKWVTRQTCKSRLEANRMTVILNGRWPPEHVVGRATMGELIDYLESEYQRSDNRSRLRRLINILRFASNYCVYPDQVTGDFLLGLRQTGKKDLCLFIKMFSQFRSKNPHLDFGRTGTTGDRFESMIWRSSL